MSFRVRAGLDTWEEGVATGEIRIRSDIHPADVARMCARARAMFLRAAPEPLVCDLGEVADTDAATLDALARLQLVAKRCGRALEVRHAPLELRELVEFVGLGPVIRCRDVHVESSREPEDGEQARGVQEERDACDPPP